MIWGRENSKNRKKNRMVKQINIKQLSNNQSDNQSDNQSNNHQIIYTLFDII